MKQNTLRGSATISGISLHTGNRVNLTLRPGPPDSGVWFRRIDLPGQPAVRAHVSNVTDVRRATTITAGDAKVHTVEHVLAALAAFEVDNAVLDMSGPEPPVCDGSAVAFAEMIEAVGLVAQDAEARVWSVPQTVFIDAGDTKMTLAPDPGYRISCTVKYNSSPLDCQYLSIEVNRDSFMRELVKARTFCLHKEIEMLMASNLICGGSLDNAVIIKGEAILSKEGLRYPDEFVRHKMLDMVGDLSLVGCRLRGQVVAVKPGHPTNVALAKRIHEMMGSHA